MRLISVATALFLYPFISNPSFAADPASSMTGDQLMVYQGSLEKLGANPELVAWNLARYDVVAISHVKAFGPNDWINPSACQDSGYPHMREMLKHLRRIKPNIRIFGYVAPTADAPVAADCGNLLKTGTSWSCPNGNCANFRRWVDTWLALESRSEGIWIDGFLVDLVAAQYLSPQMRDSAFQYIKSKGKFIMANTPTYAYNVDFAAESQYFNTGDYALMEGFYYGLGEYKSYQGSAGANAAATYLKWRQRGKNFRMAALVTEAWATPNQKLNCHTPNNYTAYSTYAAYFERGNVYQYSNGDLGINSGEAGYCYNPNAYSMRQFYPAVIGQPTER